MAKKKKRKATTPKPAPLPADGAYLVVKTIPEAARLLKVSTRTLAEWCTDPTFPGKPGGPGKQDGHFPITAIRAWHLSTHGPRAAGRDRDEELVALRKLRDQIGVDQAQVELEQSLGTIGDTEAWIAFCRRVVAAAKAQLEELADRVNARLSSKVPPAVRALNRKVISETVAETLNTIAELVAGDQDETEDLPDDEPNDANDDAAAD